MSTSPSSNKKDKNPNDTWMAPEHARWSLGMKRDYPRDDLGFPLRGSKRELKVDPRPTVMTQYKKGYEPNLPKRDRRQKVAQAPKNLPRKEKLPFREGRWSFDPGEAE